MAVVEVREQERVARARLRALRKAQTASRKAAERRRRERDKAARRHVDWLRREKAAYVAQLADPGKRDAWLALWREQPAVPR